MKYLEGHRVVLVHTNDEGIITSVLSGDMVNVLLSDGTEIPVSTDDLRMFGSGGTKPRKTEKAPPREDLLHPKVIENKSAVTNKGLLVAFETRYDIDGNAEKYRIYLVNDTTRDVVFNFELSLLNGETVKLNGISKSNTAFPLGHLMLDELNESPILDFECWPTTTNGRDKRIDKSLKIKAKQFFKKLKTTPILKGETHLYELIGHLPSLKEIENEQESLEEYTQKIAAERKKQELEEEFYRVYNIKEKATFKDELDLHIEELTDDHKSLNNAEKLHLQIQAFEQYMDDAVKVGYERVFVIHGLGKGRLRDIIASRLIRNEHVETFKNDYHAKYGFGATEVIFKKG